MSYDPSDDDAQIAHVPHDAEVSSTSRSRMRVRHVPAHRRAFHRFYREHFGLVWSMVRRFGVPPAQHEDAVQEVWLVAYRRLHTLEPDASTKAWLSSITRRIASRLRRTEHRRRRKIAAIELTTHRPGGGSVDSQDARRLLDALFERLDDDQRTALVLAQVHGLTGPEIARSLGIPLNTAYSRLRLARRKVERFAGEAGTEQAVILGALRHREQPPPRAAAHAWMLLVPQLPHAATVVAAGGAASGGAAVVSVQAGLVSTAAAGASSLKVFALTVGVGVLGLGATRVALGDREAVAAPVASASAVLEPGPTPRRADHGSSVDPAAGTLPVDLEASMRPPETTEVEPARGPASSRGGGSTRAGSSAPRARSRAGAAALGEEAELLGRAQRSLRSGDPGEALRLLEEHERRFPRGELADARRGARVRALCDLGRGAQARAEARLLAQRHPGSPVAAGVVDVCS